MSSFNSLFPNGRWLMCCPDHYDVQYEINPWMSVARAPSRKDAWSQWKELHHTILRLGGWVEYVHPTPQQPDMVFTANAALVYGNQCIVAKMRYPQRQGEEAGYRQWFIDHGYQVFDLDGLSFEGEGDALFASDKLFVGSGFRTDVGVGDKIKTLLGLSTVITCELVDPYFYHLDTCFSPLNDKQALYYPKAFSESTISEMKKHLELFEVPEADARLFACNLVQLGKTVIIPAGCAQTNKILKDLGYDAYSIPLDQFIRAGGAAKCMALKV